MLFLILNVVFCSASDLLSSPRSSVSALSLRRHDTCKPRGQISAPVPALLIQCQVLEHALKVPVLASPFGEVHPEARHGVLKGVGGEEHDVSVPLEVVDRATVPELGRPRRADLGRRRCGRLLGKWTELQLNPANRRPTPPPVNTSTGHHQRYRSTNVAAHIHRRHSRIR